MSPEPLNEETFEAVYRMYWQRLYNFALAKVHDKDVAEELVQDLFVTLWENREDFRVVNLRNYLFVSVRNRVIDHYKQRLFSDLDSARHSVASEYPLFLDELESRLQAGLERLPVKTREIFILNRLEGKNAREISAELHLPERTVEYHITQALRQLRAFISNASTLLGLLIASSIF